VLILAPLHPVAAFAPSPVSSLPDPRLEWHRGHLLFPGPATPAPEEEPIEAL
jgi:hypothetical protein